MRVYFCVSTVRTDNIDTDTVTDTGTDGMACSRCRISVFYCLLHRLWRARRLVVRGLALLARQQLPARPERLPQPPALRQHPDDAQDPDSAQLRVQSRGHARRRPPHPQTLQHRPPGAPRLHHQPVAPDRKSTLPL